MDPLVLIPFIAGQWSLQREAERAQRQTALLVLIPFIAGQWSLHGGGDEHVAAMLVS